MRGDGGLTRKLEGGTGAICAIASIICRRRIRNGESPLAPVAPSPGVSTRPSHSSMSTVAPSPEGPVEAGELSIPATLDLLGQFSPADAESLVVLDTGAIANLACFKWLDKRDFISGRRGVSPARPSRAQERFKCGGRRLGDVRHAVGISAVNSRFCGATCNMQWE